jgi:hypothetical protein
MLPLNYYLMLHLHITLQQHVMDRGTTQLPLLPVTGSKNKFRGGLLLLLLPLAPPSLILLPQICMGGLGGLHYISSGRRARAPRPPHR